VTDSENKTGRKWAARRLGVQEQSGAILSWPPKECMYLILSEPPVSLGGADGSPQSWNRVTL
jgi:hypothetical protein